MWKVRGYLIDPQMRTVREVNCEAKLDTIYALVGCQRVEVVDLPKQGSLWFDEEGRLGDERYDRFMIEPPEGSRYAWEIIGRGLVLGPPDHEGETLAAPFDSAAEVRGLVQFLTWWPCSLTCDGWHLVDARVQACAKSRRFIRYGYHPDESAALAYVKTLGGDPDDTAGLAKLHESRGAELAINRVAREWTLKGDGEGEIE